jgi:8-oxo-dGTP pyrophosphatase MutT (NUDIX family)
MYEDGWLSVIEHRVRDAADQESAYGVVHFRKVGLRILPIDREGYTYLVGQYRFGAGYYSWELPAGGGEKGEVPVKGAARELREEIGMDASQWLELPHLIPSGSVTDERQLLFLAWGLTGAPRNPDPQEALRVRRIPLAEALSMALSGEIADAGTVAILTLAHLKAARREIADEIADLLRAA